MKGILKNLFFITLPLLGISGCSGCDDGIQLIQGCHHKTDKNIPCTGDDSYYTELTRDQARRANFGICETGILRCRRDVQSVDNYCIDFVHNGFRTEEECRAEWYESDWTDTVCVGYSGPRTEICNDETDNDCDGETDEGFDDDGDGHQSSFMYRHVDGQNISCGDDCDDTNPDINPSKPESCNGIDDNCNNQIDENIFTEADTCEPEVPAGTDLSSLHINNSISACRYSKGEMKCIDGESLCVGAEFVGPSAEICDGYDNDCDGEIDYTRGEAMISDEGANCGTNLGICEFGQTRCFTQDLQCVGGVDPINMLPDSCDGLDTDCDGQTDEDAEPKICTNGCPIAGLQVCENGDWTPCNAPGPGNEDADPCNGVDDDCDGLVDEGQECQCDPAEVGPFAPDCTPDEMAQAGLSCGVGKKDCVCRDGDCQYGACYLACDAWEGENQPVDVIGTWWGACPAEQCDAWNWNCWGDHRDGLVDVPCQCSPLSPVPEIQAAFIASGGNCEQGECTAGSQSCEFNNQTQTWEMLPLNCGAVGPAEEVCDELDNDCDGEFDEDLRQFEKVDMVFAIDITGSMEEEIQNVHDAINAYAVDFEQTEHRFSLVIFPAPYGGRWDELGSPATACGAGFGDPAVPPYSANKMPYWRMTGLVGVQEFLRALNNVLNVGGLVCGSEPSYDVLQDLAAPADTAGIGWRHDAFPYLFLIGDEEGQSWRGTSEAMLSAQTRTCDGIGGCPCTPPNCDPAYNTLELHCFVSRAHFNEYDDACQSVIDINLISAPVLRDIFADVCLPSD